MFVALAIFNASFSTAEGTAAYHSLLLATPLWLCGACAARGWQLFLTTARICAGTGEMSSPERLPSLSSSSQSVNSSMSAGGSDGGESSDDFEALERDLVCESERRAGAANSAAQAACKESSSPRARNVHAFCPSPLAVQRSEAWVKDGER